MKNKVKKISLMLLALSITVSLVTPINLYASMYSILLNTGRKWYDTPKTVYFSCDFNTAEKNAVSAAMSSWNNVKSFDNTSMVTLALTEHFTNNVIHYGISVEGWVGACFYYPDSSYGQEEITGVTICLDDSRSWSTNGASGTFDIQSVVLHELGHALRVAHCHEAGEASPCWSATCLTNVMNPSTETGSGGINRTLKAYDTASYQMIYQ